MCVAGVHLLQCESLKNCLNLSLRSVNSLGMCSNETALTKESCGKLACLMMFAITLLCNPLHVPHYRDVNALPDPMQLLEASCP